MMQCPIYGRRLLPYAAILGDAGFDFQASPSGNPLYFCLHMAVQRVGFAASSGLSESVRPGRGFQPALYTLSASFLPFLGWVSDSLGFSARFIPCVRGGVRDIARYLKTNS